MATLRSAHDTLISIRAVLSEMLEEWNGDPARLSDGASAKQLTSIMEQILESIRDYEKTRATLVQPANRPTTKNPMGTIRDSGDAPVEWSRTSPGPHPGTDVHGRELPQRGDSYPLTDDSELYDTGDERDIHN